MLICLTEDSVLKLFDRKIFEDTVSIFQNIKAIYDVPKGGLFPKLYLFYDENFITPLPSITVQYIDTINLRLLSREIELGYPHWKRWGFGVYWNPLNPQVILSIKAYQIRREYIKESIRSNLENIRTNLRISLRILVVLDSAINLLDSALTLGEKMKYILDTLKGIRRITDKEYIEFEVNYEGFKETRRKFKEIYETLRDSLENILNVSLDTLYLQEDFEPKCKSVDDSLKLKSLRYSYLSESLWWFPKLYIFGETWNGNIKAPSTIYGFRVVLEFDETRRLISNAAKSIYNIEKGKPRYEKVRRFGSSGFDFGKVRNIYSKLIEVSRKLYEEGAISYGEYLRIYYSYVEARISIFKDVLSLLEESLCEISDQTYP